MFCTLCVSVPIIALGVYFLAKHKRETEGQGLIDGVCVCVCVCVCERERERENACGDINLRAAMPKGIVCTKPSPRMTVLSGEEVRPSNRAIGIVAVIQSLWQSNPEENATSSGLIDRHLSRT